MKQVVLTSGKTYFYGNMQFTANEPKSVSDELAEALLGRTTPSGTKFFEAYTKKTAAKIEEKKKGTSLLERGDITSAELKGKTGVASPKVAETKKEVIDHNKVDESSEPEEVKKSGDYAIPAAVTIMKGTKELQTLLDFTSGDTRKGITNILDELIEKMGPTGAGGSGEDAVIV